MFIWLPYILWHATLSPCLSKKGESNMRFVPFKNFYPPVAPCLVAARAVCWRPRLAGTRLYTIYTRLWSSICRAIIHHSCVWSSGKTGMWNTVRKRNYLTKMLSTYFYDANFTNLSILNIANSTLESTCWVQSGKNGHGFWKAYGMYCCLEESLSSCYASSLWKMF